MNNTLKSTPAQLKAAAVYHGKIKNKLVVMRPVDEDLVAALDSDIEKFSPLVRRLLRNHYGLPCNE